MLQSLPTDLFKYNRNLLHIDLSLNHLQTLPEGLFSFFPSNLFTNFTWNFFVCNCSLAWASSWISSLENQSISQTFQCHSPVRLRGVLLKDFNPICVPDYVWYILGVLTGVLILSIFITLLYINRWKIYYQWYILLSKKNDREVWVDNPRFVFDAFVAYSERDFQWVLHELIPHMEDNAGLPNVKLCVSDRDWDLGGSFFDNVESSIQCSCKTLCVISRHFLKSEWCKLELSLAHMQLFSENRDVLIFIFLEKIPSERLSQHEKLHRELRKKSCLDWPGEDPDAQRVFWEKLRSLILKPHSENKPCSRVWYW
nr:PREDICTED: toll-like receptor 13 [Lepisosteus oculatus]